MCVGLVCYIVLNSLRHVDLLCSCKSICMASYVKFCYASVDVALHGCQVGNGPGHPSCNATSQVIWYLESALGFACPSSRSRGRGVAFVSNFRMLKASFAIVTMALMEKLLYMRDLVFLHDMCMCGSQCRWCTASHTFCPFFLIS